MDKSVRMWDPETQSCIKMFSHNDYGIQQSACTTTCWKKQQKQAFDCKVQVRRFIGWREVRQGTYFQDVVTAKYDGAMDANFEFSEDGEAVFSGMIITDQIQKITHQD